MLRWIMTGLSVVFWLLGLIPVVNIATNIIWWMIWLMVFLHTYSHLLINPKVLALALGGFLLGLIPFVNYIPWTVIATHMIMRIAENEGAKK